MNMGKQVMRISSAIFYFFLLTTVAFSAGADPFSVGSITASKGTRVSGFLNVPPGTDLGARIDIANEQNVVACFEVVSRSQGCTMRQ